MGNEMSQYKRIRDQYQTFEELVQVGVSKYQIRQRNRECESGITLEYLTMLHNAYQDFIQDISKTIPVIRVRWDQYRSAQDVAEKLAEEFARLRTVRNVSFPGSTVMEVGCVGKTTSPVSGMSTIEL
ncbi:hypothetical protein KIPB_001907 [Kipferlia bialata]|uniref:Deoxynucleoside kinase domain-containing protein n=1 Tax=Kipferlia bialata TaxID=797122 RepID=A0A9K3GFT1_9EUKA|nr:hypothetical protein KIPB_001907 [Kipferlia bialata]|eukprot:g1907.t1